MLIWLKSVANVSLENAILQLGVHARPVKHFSSPPQTYFNIQTGRVNHFNHFLSKIIRHNEALVFEQATILACDLISKLEIRLDLC